MLATISERASSPAGPPIDPRRASVISLTSAPIAVATCSTSSNEGRLVPPSSEPAGKSGAPGSPGRISTYLSPSMPKLVTWAMAPSCSLTWGLRESTSTASAPSSWIDSTLPTRTPAMRTAALRSRPAAEVKRAVTNRRSPRSPTGMSSILMMKTPRMISPRSMNRPILAAGVMARPPLPRVPRPRGTPAPRGLGYRRRAPAGRSQ